MSEAASPTVAMHGAKPINEDGIRREIKYFRDFSGVYSEAIRSSDFKANIALLFLPLLMVPILSAHERSLARVRYGWSWRPS